MDYAAARYRMVENQVRANKVVDERVINIIAKLPREEFVPEDKKGIAYVDEAIKISENRHIMEPMILARLLQAADLHEDDVALVIGFGAGYMAAVMAQIVSTVVAVENESPLTDKSNKVLESLNIDNVAVVEGSFTEGYAKQAPYDVIVFNGSVTKIPLEISNQLAEGGRLIAVVDGVAGNGQCVLQERIDGVISQRDFFDAGTPLLPGYKHEQKFVF